MLDIWGKKIILHGDPKIKKDFVFLFEKLNIEQDEALCNDIQFLSENKGHYFIIICKKEKDQFFEIKMEQAGLKYDKDYFYIQDFFPYYNPMFLERGERKLAVWGTGMASSALYDVLNDRGYAPEISFYIDNTLDKKNFKGKAVVSPSEVKDRKDLYIVVATYRYQWEIYEQLEEYGFREGVDYTHCNTVSQDYTKLLEKVCFTEAKYSHSCSRPFGYCDVIGGNLYLCCPDFLPIPAGNMESEYFKECWNSYIAHILRLSVINGTFAFCNKQYCDLFDFDHEPKIHVEMKTRDRYAYSEYPRTLMVGIDYSCNLRCPSCRNGVCVADTKEREEIDRWAEDLLEHVIPYVNRLWLAGNGEVFFSPTYKAILNDKRCEGRSNISILSNGTLFDKKNWYHLEQTYKSIEVVISMDGIKNETIEKLRKGADAVKLKQNLEFLGKMRKEGRIKKLFLSCVLQAANVAEVYDLLEYCKNIGVDKVQFLKLKNNGIYIDDEEFDKMSIFDRNEKVKKEYSPYIRGEVLSHPLADWFNNTESFGVEKKKRLDEYDTF